MLCAYFLILGASMVVALFNDGATASMRVLIGSMAISLVVDRVGLNILAPYIDGAAFYGLLLCALKNPTKENVRCAWLGVALVSVHAAFNGASVFTQQWSVANALAIAYMWTVNTIFLLQVWALIGGDHVRSIMGAALAWLGGLVGDTPRRHHAHPSLARQKVEP